MADDDSGKVKIARVETRAGPNGAETRVYLSDGRELAGLTSAEVRHEVVGIAEVRLSTSIHVAAPAQAGSTDLERLPAADVRIELRDGCLYLGDSLNVASGTRHWRGFRLLPLDAADGLPSPNYPEGVFVNEVHGATAA